MLVDVFVLGEHKEWKEWIGASLLMASFAVLVFAVDATGGDSSSNSDVDVMPSDVINIRRNEYVNDGLAAEAALGMPVPVDQRCRGEPGQVQ